MTYDALLFVSFGGPDGPDDVMPFLEKVTAGRNIPRARLEEVAEHYYHFGGKSPINAQNLALIERLRAELKAHGPDLPIYFGNRNWQPWLGEAMAAMKKDGVKRALAFFTSAYSSYSGCRQYRENVQEAQRELEGAPEVDKLRVFYNHPGFIEPLRDGLKACLERVPAARVLFTAHSIPLTMANGCRYVDQLQEACRLVADGSGPWELVYQSRSGPPQVPWLEPDVCDRIKELHAEGLRELVILPIGFISDHMEILYDLDTEAKELCEELGIRLERAPTVGTDPRFVTMIRELIAERCGLVETKRALGNQGPSHDVCPTGCCAYEPARRPSPAAS